MSGIGQIGAVRAGVELAGFSADTVPVDWSGGLPVSVQHVGRPGGEPLLLGVEARLEAHGSESAPGPAS